VSVREDINVYIYSVCSDSESEFLKTSYTIHPFP